MNNAILCSKQAEAFETSFRKILFKIEEKMFTQSLAICKQHPLPIKCSNEYNKSAKEDADEMLRRLHHGESTKELEAKFEKNRKEKGFFEDYRSHGFLMGLYKNITQYVVKRANLFELAMFMDQDEWELCNGYLSFIERRMEVLMDEKPDYLCFQFKEIERNLSMALPYARLKCGFYIDRAKRMAGKFLRSAKEAVRNSRDEFVIAHHEYLSKPLASHVSKEGPRKPVQKNMTKEEFLEIERQLAAFRAKYDLVQSIPSNSGVEQRIIEEVMSKIGRKPNEQQPNSLKT